MATRKCSSKKLSRELKVEEEEEEDSAQNN